MINSNRSGSILNKRKINLVCIKLFKKITLPPGSYDIEIPTKDEKCVACNELLWTDKNTKLEPVLTSNAKAVYIHQECLEKDANENQESKT